MTIRRPLRIGLIGAGSVAQIAQLPTLAEADGVKIVGVVTATRQSAEHNLRRWPIERAYPSAEEMVASARLDALFALGPRGTHATTVDLALRAGLDVYCEKPLATNAAAATRLATLADEHDAILQVGFNRRYAPVYRLAHEAFARGEVQFCVAQKNRTGSEYRATFENAIHMVDMLRWFCGELEGEVHAYARADDPYEEDGVLAVAAFSSGAVGTIVAARRAGEWDERLEVYGGNTTARVLSPDSVTIARGGQAVATEMRALQYGWVSAIDTLGFRPAIEDFLACVHERRQPLVNGHEAARTQELLERILTVAELPLEEDPNRKWTSHAVGGT